MSWLTIPLGDAVSFKGGGTPSRDVPAYWNGPIPWATVKDLNFGYTIRSTQESITAEGLHRSASNLIPAGTVIIPTRMALGKAVISEVDVAINQDLKAVLPKADVDSRFLMWFFVVNGSKIEAMGKGATVKGVTLDQLERLKFPLPPLPEQRRIAAILDKADALRAKRREAIAKLDQLLQSVFLDMFGDPKSNPRGFAIRKLSDFYSSPTEGTRCGPFGSALKKSELVSSGVALWNMDNISDDGMMILPFRAWVSEAKANELAAYDVLDGDVLISRAGTVGKMCVARTGEEKSLITTNLIRLRLGRELFPEYFVALMTYCKGSVGRLRVGPDGAFTHMNTGILDSLSFPYPPLSLQNEWVIFSRMIRNQKARMNNQLGRMTGQFHALANAAFAAQ